MVKNALLILLLIFVFKNNSYSQTPNAKTLINNLKHKLIKVNDKLNNGASADYIDFGRNPVVVITGEWERETIEVDYDYQVRGGSFLKSQEKEYLLYLKCKDILSTHGKANTTILIIFDKNLNQLSEPFFYPEFNELLDIVDINKDGLNEIIFTFVDGMGGVQAKWIEIYSKDFITPLLRLQIELDDINLKDKIGDEPVTLETEYSIIDNKIIFNSTIKYYKCIGQDNKGNPTNKLLRTEYEVNEFEYKNGIIKHTKGNNIFEDERFEF